MSLIIEPPNTTRTITQPSSSDVYVLSGKDTLSVIDQPTVTSTDTGTLNAVLIGNTNTIKFGYVFTQFGAVSPTFNLADFGHGSVIDFAPFTSTAGNIYNFQNDRSGIVRGPGAPTSPVFTEYRNTGQQAVGTVFTGQPVGGTPLPSDGHGGSISGKLDFVGDPHVSAFVVAIS